MFARLPLEMFGRRLSTRFSKIRGLASKSGGCVQMMTTLPLQGVERGSLDIRLNPEINNPRRHGDGVLSDSAEKQSLRIADVDGRAHGDQPVRQYRGEASEDVLSKTVTRLDLSTDAWAGRGRLGYGLEKVLKRPRGGFHSRNDVGLPCRQDRIHGRVIGRCQNRI